LCLRGIWTEEQTNGWTGRWDDLYITPLKNTTLGCGEYNTVIPIICKKHSDK